MKATLSVRRTTRWRLAAIVAVSVGTSAAATPVRQLGAQVAPAATTPGWSHLRGYVADSVHNGPLASALVMIDGTGRRAMTDADGRFDIDSIPAGPHRVLVLHALLDTLGIPMLTPAYPFGAGETHELDLTVPGGERFAAAVCTRMQRVRGPAVMRGFVRDPDTGGPARDAKVQLVYENADSTGRKIPTIREALVDSAGRYQICGLPAEMSGKVQVFRNGVSSGEVPVEVENAMALRAFSIVARHQAIAEVTSDSGKVTRVAKGTARVTGTIVDRNGRPLAGARVMLQGGGRTAVTRANGAFTLDSLPPGTQAIVVRKLGYAVAEEPVELSSSRPLTTTVQMEDFVPTLDAMRIEAAQDRALGDVGFIGRKQTSMGYFMDGKMIDHQAQSFSDVMRMAPGFRVIPLGGGRTNVIVDSRSSSGGCVRYYVDGTPWQTMSPGDIDDFVRPNELVAVEAYHGNQAPPQFAAPGQSSCAVIVAWTVAKVRPKSTNARRP